MGKSKLVLIAALLGSFLAAPVNAQVKRHTITPRPIGPPVHQQLLPRHTYRQLSRVSSDLERNLSSALQVVRSHMHGQRKYLPEYQKMSLQSFRELVREAKSLEHLVRNSRQLTVRDVGLTRTRVLNARDKFFSVRRDLPYRSSVRYELKRAKNLLGELENIPLRGLYQIKRLVDDIAFQSRKAQKMARDMYSPHPRREGQHKDRVHRRPTRLLQEISDLVYEADQLVRDSQLRIGGSRRISKLLDQLRFVEQELREVQRLLPISRRPKHYRSPLYRAVNQVAHNVFQLKSLLQ